MPMGKGTYGSKVGRPPNKMMYGGKVKKMKDGGKLKMVDRNGKSVPFYANDGVGKMKKGGKVGCPMKMQGGGLVEDLKQMSQDPRIRASMVKAMSDSNQTAAPISMGQRRQRGQREIS
jgi:hypothetical protein|tara:strand:+ start:327 stop:680 length:354 start_codon:yes stop_codon:yes gene_type:complete